MSTAIARAIRDRDWVKRSFLVANRDLDPKDNKYRFFSTAAMKFTDTTPGGNFEINPLPQFTKYCDLPPPTNSRLIGSQGMGRFYSEVFDDNSQRIHMRFGVPQFNSLTTFFTGFYNINAGRLARTGRSPGLAFTLGKLAGMAVPFFFPQLLVIGLVGAGARMALDKPSSKYYFLKPTMPLYWHAVQTMVNNIAVNTGIVPRLLGVDAAKKFNPNYQFGGPESPEAQKLHNLLPDIFTKGGTINVYAMANRAARLAEAQEKVMAAASDTDSPLDSLIKVFSPTNYVSAKPADWDRYMQSWINGATFGKDSGPGSSLGDLKKPNADLDGQESWGREAKEEAKKDPGFLDFFKAEADDGSAFATFRVNYTGPMNESFTNTAGDSEIAGKINGMASQGRQTNFTFGGGNLGDAADGPLGAVMSILEGVMGTAKDFLSGVGEGLGVAGLGVLAGGAFVDIPKYWQSSTAQLPRANYTINLSTPYNNPISRLINIHIPLCMLLAGALPLSTGRQSYTSPFLCEIYDKGRCQTRLGMIDSISITRGTGNTGFNADGMAMGVDVTFSVLDLSSVLHMPITAAFNHQYTDALGSLDPTGALTTAGMLMDTAAGAVSGIGSLFDDETAFSDYMAVLSSMGLRDQTYGWPKFKLRMTRLATQWETWLSPAHYASVMGDAIPGRMLSLLYAGTVRN